MKIRGTDISVLHSERTANVQGACLALLRSEASASQNRTINLNCSRRGTSLNVAADTSASTRRITLHQDSISYTALQSSLRCQSQMWMHSSVHDGEICDRRRETGLYGLVRSQRCFTSSARRCDSLLSVALCLCKHLLSLLFQLLTAFASGKPHPVL